MSSHSRPSARPPVLGVWPASSWVLGETNSPPLLPRQGLVRPPLFVSPLSYERREDVAPVPGVVPSCAAFLAAHALGCFPAPALGLGLGANASGSAVERRSSPRGSMALAVGLDRLRKDLTPILVWTEPPPLGACGAWVVLPRRGGSATSFLSWSGDVPRVRRVAPLDLSNSLPSAPGPGAPFAASSRLYAVKVPLPRAGVRLPRPLIPAIPGHRPLSRLGGCDGSANASMGARDLLPVVPPSASVLLPRLARDVV